MDHRLIVRAKDLTFGYRKGEKALRNVSFELNQGQYLVILGHNGSGKSTLARILTGLLPLQGGELELFGEVPTKENGASLTRRIGIVFQNPDNQFVASSVEEDIAFGLENLVLPREEMVRKVREAAKMVGMEEFLNKAPENLSGGQKQRVALAGVLAMEPDLLILDEATSMLDPKGKREVYKAIDGLRQTHPSLSLISITHDVEEALHAGRVIVLSDGLKAMDGTPNEIFSKEEELKRLRLYPPFAYRLSSALKKLGIDIVPEGDLERSLSPLWRK